MKSKNNIFRAVLFAILLILTISVHTFVSHANGFSFSALANFICDSKGYYDLFIELIYLLFYGIACFLASMRIFAEMTVGKYSIGEIHVTKNLVTNKELMISLVFEIISAAFFFILGFVSYSLFSQIAHNSSSVASNITINVYTCILLPMFIIGIIILFIFSFYKPRYKELSLEDPSSEQSELQSVFIKYNVTLVSVATFILTLTDYFLFNCSTIYLIKSGANLNLTTLSYIGIIFKTVFSFWGLSSVIKEIIQLSLCRLSRTSKIVIQILSILINTVILTACIVICLKVINVDAKGILTGCGIIGIGGTLCLKTLITDITSSLLVIKKNNLNKGDFIDVKTMGYIKDFDYSGVIVVYKGAKSFINYSSLNFMTKHSYPYTCVKVSFSVQKLHDTRKILDLIDNSFPLMADSSESSILAEPILLSLTHGFSVFCTYTYLIPTTFAAAEKAETYAVKCISNILIESSITDFNFYPSQIPSSVMAVESKE